MSDCVDGGGGGGRVEGVTDTLFIQLYLTE